MIFPWHKNQWQQLGRMKDDKRLPHALLLSGMAGIGKAQFAEAFARLLVCEKSDLQQSCDTCHACRLVMTKVHPDVLWVQPEEENSVITIDQIREVTHFINQSSSEGRGKVVIICFADQMNMYAANALLKTLEEPTPGSLLMLVSDQSDRLLATIRSRCQFLIFPRPDREPALTWLRSQLKNNDLQPELLLTIANGAPLCALRLAEKDMLSLRQSIFDAFSLAQDPLHVATTIQDHSILRILDFSLSWITDLLRLQLGASKHNMVNHDYTKQLLEFSMKTNIDKNSKFMVYLLSLRKQISQGINLNKQLTLESIWIQWNMECII
ncbi:MAG: DNA polymerase III subunit delta' [Gammaproteobacteria bacterium RIFCSPHIGHO2_12_FULL_37_14]|nr:MAG: DNA polymerase III subunit delta' [Gammaproteobacteria bacterium RIFCSPHIGHO2_12_FULL_37_14]